MQGPEVEAFEAEFAAAVGSRYACAVSSCTAALHLALRAVGVGPRDQVITVSHTNIATANSIRYLDAVPVFVDIDRDTFNIDPSLVEAAVGPRTRAILVVHQMGMPCDLDRLLSIASDRSIPVVEDAACAVGSSHRSQAGWARIGKPHGEFACFSFHPRKVITTGDGGMITCNDEELDATVRRWRQHSMSLSAHARHEMMRFISETYVDLGYNYRLTDVQASIGRVQLSRLDSIVSRRRALAKRYAEALSAIPGVIRPAEPDWARTNWQSYCVRLPDAYDRDRVMQSMLGASIATRPGIMCCHQTETYWTQPWLCHATEPPCATHPHCARLTESEAASAETVVLPLFPEMKDDDVDRIVSVLGSALTE